MNFYAETDIEICNCALTYNLKHFSPPKINIKKQGIFEKFFNYFGQ